MVLETEEKTRPGGPAAAGLASNRPSGQAEGSGAGAAAGAGVDLAEVEEDQSAGFAKDKHTDTSEQPCPGDCEPTITARWSENQVLPFHDSTERVRADLASVPTPARVRMEADTTGVDDDVEAEITVRHCRTTAPVRGGRITGLLVQGGKVVDPATGERPVWFFDADNLLWDPWDKPFYFFTVTVDYKGLRASTPRDYRKRRQECLRLAGWHAAFYDARADAAPRGLSTQKEVEQIASLLKRVGHHEILTRTLGRRPPLGDWGRMLRNTYAYHHAGHGCVKHRKHKRRKFSRNFHGDPPDKISPAKWRSVLTMSGTDVGEAEVDRIADVPTVPRVFAYLNACVAGWDPSLANAFIRRGTQYVLAFRRTVPDLYATEMSRRFYQLWAGTYKCDPSSVPSVLFSVVGPYQDRMQPVLYSKGGGVSTAISEAADALKNVFTGAGGPVLPPAG